MEVPGEPSAAVSPPLVQPRPPASLSRRGSKFLTRTHVSFSNVPTAEEKIELQSLGGGVGARTPKLRPSASSSGGGSKHAAALEQLRTFHLNDQPSIDAGLYPTNFIKTSKYTFITFLPGQGRQATAPDAAVPCTHVLWHSAVWLIE